MPLKTCLFNIRLGDGRMIVNGTGTVYQITSGNPIPVTGPFPVNGLQFALPLDLDPSQFYFVFVTASQTTKEGSSPINCTGLQLINVFKGSSEYIGLGTQATIATVFAFANFIQGTTYAPVISGENNRISICHGFRNRITNDDGILDPFICTSPNGNETNSLGLFGFFSNLFSNCIINPDVWNSFNSLKDNSGTLVWAFHAIAKDPFENVPQIYALITPGMPHEFGVDLISAPNQFTLALKFNKSGSENFLMSGTAFAVFDSNDRAWVTNNFRAGTPNSGTHCMVFEPNGEPAPFSPLTGGGILGPGFGVAVNNQGTEIAIGNFGWGQTLYNPEFGSVSIFDNTGKVLCPPGGFVEGLTRVQGLCYDSKGNLWISSVGTQEPFAPQPKDAPKGAYIFDNKNSGVTVYIGGRPANGWDTYTSFLDNPSPFHRTFGVAVDSNDNVFVTNIGQKDKGVPSSVYKFKLNGNKIEYVTHWTSNYNGGYESFRQVSVDSQGNVYICAMDSNRIIKINNDLEQNSIVAYPVNVYKPWGITLDSEDVLYVANFGVDGEASSSCDKVDMDAEFAVTVFRPQDASSGKFVTLPTNGDPVTLANGQSLYGNLGKCENVQSYQPLMRMTSTSIDRAGNLWAMNNWKPAALVDLSTNPGGDGVVVFLSLAAPN